MGRGVPRGRVRGSPADSSQAQTDEAVAEERRLLYVGITRAREHLELSFSGPVIRGPAQAWGVTVPHGLWPDERRRRGVPRRDLDARQQAVVDGLTAWRDAHAAELRRQPASVLTSATDPRSPSGGPGTLEELGSVRGVGPMTLADIGEDVLATVRATVQEPAR